MCVLGMDGFGVFLSFSTVLRSSVVLFVTPVKAILMPT